MMLGAVSLDLESLPSASCTVGGGAFSLWDAGGVPPLMMPLGAAAKETLPVGVSLEAAVSRFLSALEDGGSQGAAMNGPAATPVALSRQPPAAVRGEVLATMTVPPHGTAREVALQSLVLQSSVVLPNIIDEAAPIPAAVAPAVVTRETQSPISGMQTQVAEAPQFAAPVVAAPTREAQSAPVAGMQAQVAEAPQFAAPVAAAPTREMQPASVAGMQTQVAEAPQFAAPVTAAPNRESPSASSPLIHNSPLSPEFSSREMPPQGLEALPNSSFAVPNPLFASEVALGAASAHTASVASTVDSIAQAVIDRILVTPPSALTRGDGAVVIHLKSDVLDGSAISLNLTGGTLTVEIAPATQQAANVIQQALPHLTAALSERVAQHYSVSVRVTKGRKK